MRQTITAEDFKKLTKCKATRSKFGAVRCRRGDAKFPSKLERAYYDHLMDLKKQGQISYFLRQVPFHLPGNVRYIVDFVVFYPREYEGEKYIEFVDVKGKATATYKMKKKMVEDLYPVKITEIKKGDF